MEYLWIHTTKHAGELQDLLNKCDYLNLVSLFWAHFLPLMARMKRDRFLLAITLIVILTVDGYFVLLPRLRAWHDLSRGVCNCNGFNGSVGNTEQVSHKMILSSNLVSLKGSQLKRLFGHPLYNIHLPELTSDERLLEEEHLIEHYRRKLNRWER